MQFKLRNLEVHASHACNLECESCSHYSNQRHSGNLSPSQAEQWMSSWAHRLAPYKFSVLGGEPLLNSDICEILYLARRHWPDSEIRIVTNGLLLDHHPSLPSVLQEIGNYQLKVTLHHDSSLFLCKINPQIELLRKWIEAFDISVRITRGYEQWTRRYIGSGPNMEPYSDQDPRSSWNICMSKYCVQLYEEKLWKCPPLAYLRMQNERHGLSDKWDHYLEYTPLDPDCTDEELAEFLGREDESYCSMCPANSRKFSKPYPLRADQVVQPVSYPELDPLLRFALEDPAADKVEGVRGFISRMSK